MCTAITLNSGSHLIGRNLDIGRSYGEGIMTVPRSAPLILKSGEAIHEHNAMIGIGICEGGFPLLFDGINEHGLGMASLNFPGNAKYCSPVCNMRNLTHFELMPYLLASCSSVYEAIGVLSGVNITDTPFNDTTPVAELHYIIADRTCCAVIEPCDDGVRIYDNPVGVLSNNPPFPFQMQNLSNYMNLSGAPCENRFSKKLRLEAYSLGMGAIGLPGDLSSMSRFVRATYTKFNSRADADDTDGLTQALRILESVAWTRGVISADGIDEQTEYTSVADLDTLTYYVRTYKNNRLSAVRLKPDDIDNENIKFYEPDQKQDIKYLS